MADLPCERLESGRPPFHYMGIVKDVYPGSDGLIRSVKVKTKVTELVRPIVKIVLLEGSM